MKRKKIKAWAVVNPAEPDSLYSSKGEAQSMMCWPGDELVRLVEHDPRKDAVVRAALKYVMNDGSAKPYFVDLELAVERYLRPTATSATAKKRRATKQSRRP